MVSLRTRVTGSADVAAGMVYVRCGEVDEVEVEVRDRETRSDRLWHDGGKRTGRPEPQVRPKIRSPRWKSNDDIDLHAFSKHFTTECRRTLQVTHWIQAQPTSSPRSSIVYPKEKPFESRDGEMSNFKAEYMINHCIPLEVLRLLRRLTVRSLDETSRRRQPLQSLEASNSAHRSSTA